MSNLCSDITILLLHIFSGQQAGRFVERSSEVFLGFSSALQLNMRSLIKWLEKENWNLKSFVIYILQNNGQHFTGGCICIKPLDASTWWQWCGWFLFHSKENTTVALQVASMVKIFLVFVAVGSRWCYHLLMNILCGWSGKKRFKRFIIPGLWLQC